MIYPYKGIAFEITKRLSDDWGLGHSPTGWMMAEVFYGYIWHVFTPHFWKHTVKFPVILFINGHHIQTYQLWTVFFTEHKSDLCLPKCLKTLAISGCCNIQTTENGLEYSSPWVAQAKFWNYYTKNDFSPVQDGGLKKYALVRSSTGSFWAYCLYVQDTENSDFENVLRRVGDGQIRNSQCTNPSKIITNKMFEGTVVS